MFFTYNVKFQLVTTNYLTHNTLYVPGGKFNFQLFQIWLLTTVSERRLIVNELTPLPLTCGLHTVQRLLYHSVLLQLPGFI